MEAITISLLWENKICMCEQEPNLHFTERIIIRMRIKTQLVEELTKTWDMPNVPV